MDDKTQNERKRIEHWVEENPDYLPYIFTFVFITAFTIFILNQIFTDKKDLLAAINVLV